MDRLARPAAAGLARPTTTRLLAAVAALSLMASPEAAGATPCGESQRAEATRLQAAGETARAAARHGRSAAACLEAGDLAQARQDLDAADGLLDATAEPRVAATLAANRGALEAASGEPRRALSAYRRAAVLAGGAGATDVEAAALANASVVALAGERPEAAEAHAREALAAARTEPPSPARAQVLLRAGETLATLSGPAGPRTRAEGAAADTARAAHEALSLAGADAASREDAAVESWADGLLGTLYARHGRSADAFEMTRRALFLAQAAGAPRAEMRWQTELGRLQRAAGRPEEALAALRAAVLLADEERTGPGARPDAFGAELAPVYLALVDLLLAESDRAPDAGARETALREARATVERLKVAELRDYFRDGCVDAQQASARPLEEVSASAAVLYPIVLPDRLELLLSLPGGLARERVEIGAEALEAAVRGLRRTLEKRTTREYLPHARRLHGLLVAPIAGHLQDAGVDTLVWVPGGVLRTVPLAALHDGERFLVERYALALTPGLTLTDPRPMARGDVSLLVAGVSLPREGFPALPFVRREVEALERLYGGTVLLDQSFAADRVTRELEQGAFDLVHIASHARFTGDPEQSFLLAGDGRLSLSRLESALEVTRFRDRPVELLSLTACETASGDERAALGLAGVAVKAGARSALGSLWRVEDRATSELVTAFYHALAEPGVSRAEALRRAQRRLLAKPQMAHPGYWAPFLLISSWL